MMILLSLPALDQFLQKVSKFVCHFLFVKDTFSVCNKFLCILLYLFSFEIFSHIPMDTTDLLKDKATSQNYCYSNKIKTKLKIEKKLSDKKGNIYCKHNLRRSAFTFTLKFEL